MLRHALVLVTMLAVCCTANAGQNPDIQIFLEFENGTNYLEPPANTLFSVYVCFTNFGPGGGLRGATLKVDRTFDAIQFDEECLLPGALSFGDPEVEGWTITGSTCEYPDGDGVVVAGRIDYFFLGTPGTLTLLPHNVEGNAAIDCDIEVDGWCVRSVPSGNAGIWDTPPPGDCAGFTAWHVDASNTGFEDGTAAYPFNTIQEGVDAAANLDTVLVHPGVYDTSYVFDYLGTSATATVFIDKNIILKSSDGALVTTIEGHSSTEIGVVCMPDTAAGPSLPPPVVEGFTIREQTQTGVLAVYSEVRDNAITGQLAGVSTSCDPSGYNGVWRAYAPALIEGNAILAIDMGIELGHGPDERTVAEVRNNEIYSSAWGVYSQQPLWGSETRRIELVGNMITSCERGVHAGDSSHGPGTEIVLHGNGIHGNSVYNVALLRSNLETSWDIELGGSLTNANDFHDAPLNVRCTEASADLTYNYWGSVECAEVLDSVSGSHGALFPFTSSDHTELHHYEECGPMVRGYLGCSTEDSYGSFDLFSHGIVSTGSLLEEGDYPYDATMRPSGQEVWIPGAAGDGVVVLNTSSDTVSHRIAGVGDYPVSVAFTLDDSRALVSCRNSHQVSIVRTDDYSVTGTLPMVWQPGNLAVDPATGNIYMAEWYGETLCEISPDGTSVLRVVTLPGAIWQLVVDPSGEWIYVTDRQNDQVFVVHRATLLHAETIAVGDDPRGIDVTSDGSKLVVVCEDDSSVWVIDTSDWSTSSFTVYGSAPRDVDILDLTNEAFIAAGQKLVSFDLDSGPPYHSWSSSAGCCTDHNVVAVQPQISSVGTGVDELEELPLSRALSCFPNPLEKETTIRYAVRVSSDVTVSVYDVRGRLVATLEDGPREPGVHEVVWRGLNSDGLHVANGVYFVSVSADGDAQTGKLLLVK